MLFLIKEHTNTLIEQRKSRPQETLQIELNKQLETFSFSPRKNLFEEGKWMIAVKTFEATNSVLNVTEENNSFSI